MHRDTSSCSRPGAEPWGYSDKGDDDNGTAPALPGTRVTPLSATGSLQRVKETTAEVAVGARSPLKAAAGGLGTAEPAEVAGERGLRTTERAVFGNRDHGLHSVATRLQRSRGSPASLLQVSSPSASEAAAGGVPCARPRRSTPGIARPTEGSVASARRPSATRPEGVGICPGPATAVCTGRAPALGRGSGDEGSAHALRPPGPTQDSRRTRQRCRGNSNANENLLLFCKSLYFQKNKLHDHPHL